MLAENVANADTPNFRPRDLSPPKFDAEPLASRRGSPVSLTRTPKAAIIAGVALERDRRSAPTSTATTKSVRPATRSISKKR